jgi:hypothetical protein
MTGRNPAGTEDFPSPGCSDVAYGPQRPNAIIGAYEDFLDPVCGTDDLSFHLVLELPATETPAGYGVVRAVCGKVVRACRPGFTLGRDRPGPV